LTHWALLSRLRKTSKDINGMRTPTKPATRTPK